MKSSKDSDKYGGVLHWLNGIPLVGEGKIPCFRDGAWGDIAVALEDENRGYSTLSIRTRMDAARIWQLSPGNGVCYAAKNCAEKFPCQANDNRKNGFPNCTESQAARRRYTLKVLSKAERTSFELML